MPVARFLPAQEAYPLLGRLRAEGLDARLAPQGDSLYPYRPHGGAGAVMQVIVPEREADRARWILRRVAPDRLAEP